MEKKLEKAKQILNDLKRQGGRNDIYLIKLAVMMAKLCLKQGDHVKANEVIEGVSDLVSARQSMSACLKDYCRVKCELALMHEKQSDAIEIALQQIPPISKSQKTNEF